MVQDVLGELKTGAALQPEKARQARGIAALAA
jgi:hypothetical protein